MQIYLVGGAVRDSLLGLESKDLDYVMVLDNIDITVEEGYQIMKKYMLEQGFDIFLETPEMFTIRARFPKSHKNEGITGDFVLARKEVGYIEDTRRPKLELGTLYDDLIRRDFTVNAMAQDDEGNIIDYFGGNEDLQCTILNSPQPAEIMLLDDPLRLLRALRFSITKKMDISIELKNAMKLQSVIQKLDKVVSQERIREELNKMFKYNSIKTMELLIEQDKQSYGLLNILFKNGYYLEMTNKKK
jgi:tRNA nucleotidyltransferase/poly(A) polymerase